MVIKAISHKVRIPMHFRTKILGRDREHAFWKMLIKAISQKRGRVVRILHQRIGWCEFRTMHYSLVQDAKFVVLSNGKNFWFLRVGNAG